MGEEDDEYSANDDGENRRVESVVLVVVFENRATTWSDATVIW